MKFKLPPSEDHGWTIYNEKATKNNYFFSILPHSEAFLAIFIEANEPVELLLKTKSPRHIQFIVQPNTWTLLPYALESYLLGSFFEALEFSKANIKFQLASYQWNVRQYRMKAYLDSKGDMLFVLKHNKNGQIICLPAYDDKGYEVSEDCYVYPPLYQMPEKQVHLLASRSRLPTKTLDQSRYFSWMKNDAQN